MVLLTSRRAGRFPRLMAVVLALMFIASTLPPPARAVALDWDIPGGHYYTQTGGYAVVDGEGIAFWSEFQRLGGVQAVGYPVSRRFQWNGFTVQAMQRTVFQWRPEIGQVYFVNVFDLLTEAGKDDWLYVVRQTPRPLPASFDGGKSWNEVVKSRLALLDENPAIKQQFFGVVGDPILMNGLPTSRVTDMGNNYTLRAQRAVFQQWKQDVPWAKAGQVTVALGGSIAIEAGLVPVAATKLEAIEDPVLQIINQYRAAAGVPPARLNPALLQAARNHVAYYDLHRGDPSLAGMGLHQETPGATGFTGAWMGDRAKAAGYKGGVVTENAGFGDIKQAIEWYMRTAYHRVPLIHPSALDIGYAYSESSGFIIIDFGLPRENITTPLPSVYPPPGAKDVPTTWDGGETPNPAPGIPRPLGNPISILFAVYQKIEWKTFGLKDATGTPVEFQVARKDWDRSAIIIPVRPLAPGQTYSATVEAVADGKPVKKQWSFTTRR